MNDSTNKKNIYKNHPGPASDYKNREFLQWEKSELVENMDLNDTKEIVEVIKQKSERNSEIIKELIKTEKYKINYETKTKIIDDYNEAMKQIRSEKLLLEDKNIESIINKNIIMQRITKLRDFYKEKKIPRTKQETGKDKKDKKDYKIIEANIHEIREKLQSKTLKNNQLANVGKILRWTRFNFNGIILEEGKSWETVVKKGDEYVTTEEENPEGESIIHTWEKVLMRHLEGDKINPEIMEEALKTWVDFFERHFHNEFFRNEEKKVKYIMSGSWLRNKEFRIFYKKKIWDEDLSKPNNVQETFEWMDKIWIIFVTHKEKNETKKTETNDRFLKVPLRIPVKDDKYLSSKEINGKIIEIGIWINTKRISDGNLSNTWEKITKNNINPEIVNQLKKQRNIDKKDNKVKINGMIIARILWWKPIESGICLLPIENIKYQEFLGLSPEQFDQSRDGRRKFDKEAQEVMLAWDKNKAFEFFDKQEKIIDAYIRKYSGERPKWPSKELLRFHQAQLLAYQEKNTEAIKILRWIQPSNIGITETYYQATIAFFEKDKEKLQRYAEEKNDPNHTFIQRFLDKIEKTYLEAYGNI